MADLAWLQAEYPEAYQDLPECYRNDSCLEFFLDECQQLWAAGIPGDHLESYRWIWYAGENDCTYWKSDPTRS
jgi:hypothetical protein